MTTARVLAGGIYFGEGPRWHADRLWFSDFHDHAVKSLDPSGAVRMELRIDDQPSGLGWLRDGRLLVVAMRRRQVLRVDADGIRVHAELGGVADYHANDMVVDALTLPFSPTNSLVEIANTRSQPSWWLDEVRGL